MSPVAYRTTLFKRVNLLYEEVKERIDEPLVRDGYPKVLLTTDKPYEKVQRDYMATLGLDSTVSEREWQLRFNTEGQYLSLLKKHLTIFGYDQKKEEKFRDEIDRSLLSMEGRHKTGN